MLLNPLSFQDVQAEKTEKTEKTGKTEKTDEEQKEETLGGFLSEWKDEFCMGFGKPKRFFWEEHDIRIHLHVYRSYIILTVYIYMDIIYIIIYT